MIELTEVLDLGDDLLLVKAVDADGNEHEATGWVSATTNHYSLDAYDAKGNLSKDAKPRAMTPAEVGDYAISLLAPTTPEPDQPEPRAVPFTVA